MDFNEDEDDKTNKDHKAPKQDLGDIILQCDEDIEDNETEELQK